MKMINRRIVLVAALLMTAAPLAAQNTAAPLTSTTLTPEVLARLAELNEQARAMVQPLPAGEVRILQAAVIDVTGRAQWRTDETAPWKSAEVDDLLVPGSRLRTGGNSSLTLRVGLNTTLHVGSRTRATLPEVAQSGDVLKTTMGLDRGRLDFKVDRIGLTNDFRVVTPSMTLAVRGTGGAVRYGGLGGTEVVGAQYNLLRAIELRYFLAKFTLFMSGEGSSSEDKKNPALNELFKTIGPPAQFLRALGLELINELLTSGFFIDIGQNLWNERQAQNIIDEFTGGQVDPQIAMYVMALCAPQAMPQFFSDYWEPELINNFKFVDSTAFALAEINMESICVGLDQGAYNETVAFNLMLAEVSRYCEVYDQVGSNQHARCVSDFFFALEGFANPGESSNPPTR